MGNEVFSITPSYEATLKCCGRQIDFNSQQIHLPTDAALKGFCSFGAQKFIGQEVFEGEVHMNESKCHSIATHDPAAMRNEIFMARGLKSKPRYAKPDCPHAAEADGRYRAYIMIESKRNYGNSADKAPVNINFAELTVYVRPLFTKVTFKQYRANDNCRNCRRNMDDEKAVIGKVPFFKQERRYRSVVVKNGIE